MYATIADMQLLFEPKELEEVTDTEGLGAINIDKLNRAIVDASAEIDAYLIKTHELPINPVPSQLNRLTCDIARYNIWAAKPEIPAAVKTKYDSAIKFLKSVAAGQAGFVDGGNVSAPNNDITIQANIKPRQFTRDSMRGY